MSRARKPPIPPDQPAAQVWIYYTKTSIGKSIWLDPAKAEKLATSLRRKHKVKIVQRGTQP
jgi:hypothetical protein